MYFGDIWIPQKGSTIIISFSFMFIAAPSPIISVLISTSMNDGIYEF